MTSSHPTNPVQQKRWPNLANALKYSLSMLAVMMGMYAGNPPWFFFDTQGPNVFVYDNEQDEDRTISANVSIASVSKRCTESD
jgi:hypothetical protein